MAANSQQGKYLGTTLVGFTAFPAGLIHGRGAGRNCCNCWTSAAGYFVCGFLPHQTNGTHELNLSENRRITCNSSDFCWQ